MERVCGEADVNDSEASYRLLHFRVNSSFVIDCFVFASEDVRQEVYERLYRNNKQKLLEFIAVSDGVNALSILCEHLFEEYVHSVLPQCSTSSSD